MLKEELVKMLNIMEPHGSKVQFEHRGGGGLGRLCNARGNIGITAGFK